MYNGSHNSWSQSFPMKKNDPKRNGQRHQQHLQNPSNRKHGQGKNQSFKLHIKVTRSIPMSSKRKSNQMLHCLAIRFSLQMAWNLVEKTIQFEIFNTCSTQGLKTSLNGVAVYQ